MAEAARAPRGAVRALHLLCLLLITHGSAYPWHFAWPARGVAAAWHDLLANTALWSGLGDVVGNVALFVPLGVLAWLDLSRAVPRARSRLAVVAGLGILFALLLQWVQFFVPERVPQLSDVVWNALGLFIGVALVSLIGGAAARAMPAREGRGAAMALVACWLVAEWWPLVPTIDWQHVKDALKPLLRDLRWNGTSFAEATLMVLAVARLLRGQRAAAPCLVLLAGAALAGKLFITGQSLSPGRSAGVAFGLLLALPLSRLDGSLSARWLVVAVLAWIGVDGLRPFELADAPNPFHWLPFTGVLEGSLGANSLALLQLVFWVGVAMLMARDIGARLGPVAVALSLWLLLIEIVQVMLPGRSADTTAVLAPWLWWLVLQSRAAGAGAGTLSRPPPHRP